MQCRSIIELLQVVAGHSPRISSASPTTHGKPSIRLENFDGALNVALAIMRRCVFPNGDDPS
jgi:hypothetical protein